MDTWDDADTQTRTFMVTRRHTPHSWTHTDILLQLANTFQTPVYSLPQQFIANKVYT